MLDQLEDDRAETVFRDLIMLTLGGFIVLVLLLLPHISEKLSANAEVRNPGSLVVEMVWPESIDADVDLWVAAPGDRPVGYSNQSGSVFNLLRDDMGHVNDLTRMNYESAYTRGLPNGEYVVNAHFYRIEKGADSVRVTFVVSKRRPAGGQPRQLLSTEIMLNRVGDEVTAFRFRLDERGELVAGSVNALPKPLRSS